MTVYMVERLLYNSYEVVALTSTKEKGQLAAERHFEKIHGKIKHREEFDLIRETKIKNEVPMLRLCYSNEELADEHYLVVPCEIDNPYWFGKEET